MVNLRGRKLWYIWVYLPKKISVMKRGKKVRAAPDYYSQLAKKEGYPARSVYKLKEIQDKTGILKKGYSVLDLGAAPGSWSLFASRKVGKEGKVHGIDLKQIPQEPEKHNLVFSVGDMYDDSSIEQISGGLRFNVILSDAAPNTSGNRTIDSSRSLALAERAIELSEKYLLPGGHIAVKVFQGGDEKALTAAMRKLFASVKTLKPKACRKESFEVYLIGLGRKDE